MHFLRTQSYSLSPEQYLQRFKKPHSVVSNKGSPQDDIKDNQILEKILVKCYNDDEKSLKTKQQTVEELSSIINAWINQHSSETELGSVKIKNIKTRNTGSAERRQNQADEINNLQQHVQSRSEGGQIEHKEDQLSSSQSEKDNPYKHYGLKIFGSYSLKANSHDGDIDMVVVVPEYFSREKHFFGLLVEKFRKNQNITEVLPIPDALVPLTRLTINDIQIDLLMSRISVGYLCQHPNFFQSTQRSTINEKQLKSINGYRTSLYLRKKIAKFDNFQIALKALKMWAKNKGIYSQIYGYLGGAAFSIMLAKITQLYPNYSSLALLDRFFFIYSEWLWTMPVKIEEGAQEDNSDGAIAIYTPLQPHMNTAHSFSKITHNITRKYFKEATKAIQQINKGKKTWEDLFKPTNFFAQYGSFLQISVMGQNKDDFIPWRGNIQSKLRKFIRLLQMQSELVRQIEVNPYPKSFCSKHKDFQFCHRYYIGFNCSPKSQISDQCEIDLTQPVRIFLQLLEGYPGTAKAPQIINIGFEHLDRASIPSQVLDSMRHYQ